MKWVMKQGMGHGSTDKSKIEPVEQDMQPPCFNKINLLFRTTLACFTLQTRPIYIIYAAGTSLMCLARHDAAEKGSDAADKYFDAGNQ